MIARKEHIDGATCRELFSKYIASRVSGTVTREVSDQLKTAMDVAKRYVAPAIMENHTQIKAIGDVAEQTEEGIDPLSLLQTLVTEFGKAGDPRY